MNIKNKLKSKGTTLLAVVMALALALVLGGCGQTVTPPASTPIEGETEAYAQLKALTGTYQELFSATIFKSEYDQLWIDDCAAVAGASQGEAMAEMMKASVGGEIYGQEATDAYTADADATKFYCGFTNDLAQLTFDGSNISGTDSSGNALFSHGYTYIGSNDIGNEVGIEGFGGYTFQSEDADSGEFTYFIILPDTPDSTYHIEFRYGSDLEALKLYGTGDYAYWVAAGIPIDATQDDIEQVIALFCEENLKDMVAGNTEAAEQRTEYVGVWDASEATLADMHTYPGYENAEMYVEFKADGTAATYVALDGETFTLSSEYSYFVYDNDGDAAVSSGIYIVDSENEGVKAATYDITTENEVTTLSLNSAEGVVTYVKR